MEITMTRTAIRKDRELTAAHAGAGLLTSCAPTVAKPATGSEARVTFANAPAYVADQGSHPPRGCSPA